MCVCAGPIVFVLDPQLFVLDPVVCSGVVLTGIVFSKAPYSTSLFMVTTQHMDSLQLLLALPKSKWAKESSLCFPSGMLS